MFGKSGLKQEAISGECKNCESFTFCHESELRIIDDLMLAASCKFDQLHIIGLQIDQKMFLMKFLEKFPTSILHIIVCVCFC